MLAELLQMEALTDVTEESKESQSERSIPTACSSTIKIEYGQLHKPETFDFETGPFLHQFGQEIVPDPSLNRLRDNKQVDYSDRRERYTTGPCQLKDYIKKDQLQYYIKGDG